MKEACQEDLTKYRDEFYVPAGVIYLDGNSLGLLSRRAEAALLRALDEWKHLGIGGWTDGSPPWLRLAEDLGRRTAALVGADAASVVVTNSTTVNLHQLLSTLYHPAGRRTRLLIDGLAFPSDRYALDSHLGLRGYPPETHLKVVASDDGRTLDDTALCAALTDEIAMAVLPSVVYTSGQLLDIPGLTQAAHARGIVIGFDCSHSVGAIPHYFDKWGVDFAFWCGYKYLNGGPGAAAGLYLNARHVGREPGLAGWFGARKETQFDMAPTLDPASGAGSMQIGTPNIFSMAPLLGSLEMIEEVGIECLRARSLELTTLLTQLADSELACFGFEVVSPREPHRRGGHVALAHPESARIAPALKAAGVIPDFRPPDIIRLAPVALYISHDDCLEAVARLRIVMTEKRYEAYTASQGVP